MFFVAAVAQLVERQIVALHVAGSIPVGRPIFFRFANIRKRNTTKPAYLILVAHHKLDEPASLLLQP